MSMTKFDFDKGKLLWILEDDKGCNFLYHQILDHRYQTRYFETLTELHDALDEMENGQQLSKRPHLLIADLILPDGSFLDFLGSERAEGLFHLPFFVVSSIDDLDALRFCFQEGAVDYLIKPYKKSEILVKIENKLTGQESQVKSLDELSSITLDGHKIKNLTSKEMQLLTLFLASSERIVNRQDILEKAWNSVAVHPKTVDVHLYNLRKKLIPLGYVIKSEGRGRWILSVGQTT